MDQELQRRQALLDDERKRALARADDDRRAQQLYEDNRNRELRRQQEADDRSETERRLEQRRRIKADLDATQRREEIERARSADSRSVRNLTLTATGLAVAAGVASALSDPRRAVRMAAVTYGVATALRSAVKPLAPSPWRIPGSPIG